MNVLSGDEHGLSEDDNQQKQSSYQPGQQISLLQPDQGQVADKIRASTGKRWLGEKRRQGIFKLIHHVPQCTHHHITIDAAKDRP
jgi:hypothetical protein